MVLPRAIMSTKRALVMSFVEGDNLCKMAEFRHKGRAGALPKWLKKKFGTRLLTVLAKAWG